MGSGSSQQPFPTMPRWRMRRPYSAALLCLGAICLLVRLLAVAAPHGESSGFVLHSVLLRRKPGCTSSLCLATRRGTRLIRRVGLFETGLVSAAAVFILNRPKSAPGPSEELAERKQEIRQETVEAEEAVVIATVEETAAAQLKLTEAMQRLKEVEDQLSAAEADLHEYPVPPYLADSCQGGTVNVCITGSSGVGKSSWINAIRRLTAKDLGAAKTGVTETTAEPQKFTFPKPFGVVRRNLSRVRKALQNMTTAPGAEDEQEEQEDSPICLGDRLLLQNCQAELNGKVAEVVADLGNYNWEVQLASGTRLNVGKHQVTGVLAECVIWDLPGVGTPNYPQKTYLKNMGIRHFDMVVLITASRFTEAELMLLDELRRWQVPFFLVRNKVDSDVELEIEKEEEDAGELSDAQKREVELQTITTIKSYFESEFDLNDIYCISTRRNLRDQYDFHRLERDMEVVLKQQRSAS